VLRDNRNAEPAGTGCFLSFSHLDVASNPPGWGRVYAHLGGQILSMAAFKEAIRGGRTVVTNAHFGDLVSVLDEARSFYRQVAETAER
jgi:hypothetical protein